MTRHCLPGSVPGCICLLVLGLLAGPLLAGPRAQAQDRGAPRFGPPVPGDTAGTDTEGAGRLWSLAAPPLDRFSARYDVAPDSAWTAHLRQGLLRLPGCTAALVSAEGLALTTADCVRRHLDGRPEGPVVAEQPSDERRLPGLHADRLLGVTDVTATVRAARNDTTTVDAVRRVEQRLQAEAGANRHVTVGGTAGGPPYTAYTYRRHTDVRLAFLPERAVSAFGGVGAAMTYPRHALNVAVLRVYTDEGTPVSPRHVFEPAAQGVRPGAPVFAAGRAPRTHRAESAEQLSVRRDVELPARRDRLQVRVRALRAHLDTTTASPEEHAALRDAAHALKRTRARLQALQNDYVQSRLQRRDDRLRRALRRDPALQRRYGGLLDSVAALQDTRRQRASAYRAFGEVEHGSATYRRLLAARPADADLSPASAPADGASRRPSAVEKALLTHRLGALRQHLRPDTAAVRRVFQGRTPAQLATALINTSALARPSAATTGPAAPAVPPADPAAPLVPIVREQAAAFRDDWRALSRADSVLTRRLARARRAARASPTQSGGTQPGGRAALRLTDGRVEGYPYNGTVAPPFATFFGLYEQSHAFGGDAPWALPERWHDAANRLDRSTPLTLAVSTDGAVSNDGAPLLTPSLKLVGVATGPNIQGVAGTYLFLPERMRTVGVAVRGLRQALATVYKADGLADELFGRSSARPSTSRR